uniref:Peroxisomal membrane protein 2 n=1 Tax=Anopheles epiroticus TaxID=199890 RepID=A0A182PJU1_9DIPT
MSLSKPIYNLLGSYLEQLFEHPLRTKAITSCVIASSANLVSQKLGRAKQVNTDSVMAYGLFGLIFTGPLSHFFYGWLDRVTNDTRFKKLLMVFGERAIFAPIITALSLYFISRFEYKSHEDALKNLQFQYSSILRGNWKFLTLPVFINFNYIPPMLRVLFANIIGFCWMVVLSTKRRKAEQQQAQDKSNKKSALDLPYTYLVIRRRSRKEGDPARRGIDGERDPVRDRGEDCDEWLLERLRERLLPRSDELWLCDEDDRLRERELAESLLELL